MAQMIGNPWIEVAYLRPYHPFHQGLNPQFGKLDQQVLDFKDGKQAAIEAVFEEFVECIRTLKCQRPILLAMVPGHRASESNAERPLAIVLVRLMKRRPHLYLAEPDLLIRRKTVKKLSSGGSREIAVHLKSIKVIKTALRASTVAVLDDVATSGNSLEGCRKLLLKAGAKRVATIALSYTQ